MNLESQVEIDKMLELINTLRDDAPVFPMWTIGLLKAAISQLTQEARQQMKYDFIQHFTNDHDIMNPPRWLRGVALDEQHLLDQILEWFDDQLKNTINKGDSDE